MKEPSFSAMARKDMKFEAEWVLKDLHEYADKVCLERYYIEEVFLKTFNKLRKEGETK